MVDTLTLGTLAADDVISESFPTVLTEKSFFLSYELVCSMRGGTPTEGPVHIGIAHSDYSAAEIEEAIEAAGAWDEGDLVAREQSRRMVRLLGVFPMEDQDEVLNDGKPFRGKLRWPIEAGKTIAMFGYNRSGAILTDGATLQLEGGFHTRKT